MTVLTLSAEDCRRGNLILVNRRYSIHQAVSEKQSLDDSWLLAADPAWPEILLAQPAALALPQSGWIVRYSADYTLLPKKLQGSPMSPGIFVLQAVPMRRSWKQRGWFWKNTWNS